MMYWITRRGVTLASWTGTGDAAPARGRLPQSDPEPPSGAPPGCGPGAAPWGALPWGAAP